jgi:DNA-binding LytR/AlgR family response regulator
VGSNELQRAIERSEPGVVIFGEDFSVHHVSRNVVLLFGIEADRLFKGGLLDLHGAAASKRIQETLRLVRESQRQVPVSLKLVTTAGEDRFLMVKLLPLLGPGASAGMVCGFFYDITTLVTADRKLVRIPVSLRDEIQLLGPEEIVFVQADNIYSRVTTPAAEYHCDLPLGALGERLSSEQFCRIHRSYLVNVGHVRKVHRGRSECTVSLAGFEARLPISRDRMDEFLAAVGLK